jgi:hypothetical protein
MQTVEYIIIMDKAHSDELVKMAEATGEDNEQAYLEERVINMINEEKEK